MPTAGDADGGFHTSRVKRELAVPLAALASLSDKEQARGLLAMHQPRAVVARICSGCGEPWPCVEVRYGWAVTGINPDLADGSSGV